MTSAEDQLIAAADRLLAVGRAEGIEIGHPLGAWLEAQAEALLGLGAVLKSQGEGISQLLGQIEATAASEVRTLQVAIEGANHVVRQGEHALRSARQALMSLVVERDHLVNKMIKETLPLFANKLQGALVIEAEAWNARKRDMRFAMAAAIAGALFMVGYTFCWWQDSGQVAAYQRCIAHPVQADGQLYCQASGLFGASKTLPQSSGN